LIPQNIHISHGIYWKEINGNTLWQIHTNSSKISHIDLFLNMSNSSSLAQMETLLQHIKSILSFIVGLNFSTNSHISADFYYQFNKNG